MRIVDFMDMEVLQRIQDQFSDSTGLAAIAVDAEGNYITKGSNFTDFCMKYTRGCQKGLERCVKCDTECKGTYFCHAGLMDFASDILVDGEKVGSIIGGQVLPGTPDLEKFASIARELGIDEKKYVEAVKKVPVRSEKVIRSAAGLLSEIVNIVVSQAYYRKRDSSLLQSITCEMEGTIESIELISGKTRQLEAIASKQKILALNATIEAARSGEAGAGFAVVAGEMGKLSENSTQLYKDIKDGIGHISSFVKQMDYFLKKE